MLGSLITRCLIMALGYAYPAYECYKTVEKNKPEIEQLRSWCQYWILVALLTIFERVGDTFISWVPMYCEAKLAFYIYLWYPKTRGTTYVYDTFFQPYVAKHEIEIDRILLELRARAGDAVALYLRKFTSYGQTRFFEILQYIASQSQQPRSQPVQQQTRQQQPLHQPPPIFPARQPPRAAPAQEPTPVVPVQEPPPFVPARRRPAAASTRQQPCVLPTRQSSIGQLKPQPPPQEPSPLPPGAVGSKTAKQPAPEEAPTAAPTAAPSSSTSSNSSKPSEAEPREAEVEITNEEPNHALKESVIEETIRVTRGRLRKTLATSNSTL